MIDGEDFDDVRQLLDWWDATDYTSSSITIARRRMETRNISTDRLWALYRLFESSVRDPYEDHFFKLTRLLDCLDRLT